MDWNESIKSNRIEIIKSLFENGVQNTIENCRKNFRLATPFNIPVPVTYEGGGDFRNLSEKIFEDSCRANIHTAFQMAYPIRDKIDFYDLICCAMPYTNDYEKQKYIYTEIIKHTKYETIRDYYVEELYILNLHRKIKNNSEIDSSIYPYLLNKEKTIKGLKILIGECEMRCYNPYQISGILINDAEDKKNIEFTISGSCYDMFENGKDGYIINDVRFRFYELKSFSISSGETSFIVFYPTNKINEYSDSLIFVCGEAIKVEAKKMEVISIQESISYNEYD